ncbi:MAG TPA: VWA domain-containing protein [Acidobacteriaceae bacterium]|jgi:Ca-activated chloride channel family protein|nr:VWA domain-containing protein [Acidobacteriaceae bacterium]
MLEKVSRSRLVRWTAPAVLLAFLFPLQHAPAQNNPAPAAQPPSAQARPASTQNLPAASAIDQDYRRREIQPNLGIDRDPVLSPDAADNGPVKPAQPLTTAKGQNNVYVLHENVDEVLLPCTVVDEQGNLVTDLSQANFRVWEDNTPQTITSFDHGDVPISMGILVDNSGSMREKRQAVNEAALDLVKQSNPRDTEFVVNFNEKAYLDQGFTSNISYLERGLSHYDARGTTAIYDAVAASADELSHYSKWPTQVILIITDGEDNASRLTLAQAVRRVKQLNGPVVYSIGLLYDSPNKAEVQRARDELQTLANETGGVAYFPRSLDEVNDIAREVARVIRNRYTVGYTSTKPINLGGYRHVHVEARMGKHQLTVRTRDGYFPRELKQMREVQTAQEIKTGTPPPTPQQ